MALTQKFLFGLIAGFIVGASSDGASATAPAGKPNIIVIFSDDMGYSDISPYGGEIRTPALQELADNGKIFTQFYNTGRCCPSRASLLTGLYAHQAGVGHLLFESGYPGYSSHLTSNSVTLAEALKGAGYSTYMAGKWHLAPLSFNASTDAEHWPLQRGFDNFYGTIAGSGSFYDPYNLCRDETLITPDNDPKYKPDHYYYTDALSDNALMFLEQHESASDSKPFFLYLAYTTAHWPMHAPEEAIAEYTGKYDKGYEAVHAERVRRMKELNLIPEAETMAPPVGNWDSVKNKKTEARLMETYAGMVTRMDEGIGRIVDHLRTTGELDNTLIVYLQDNGGSMEDRRSKTKKVAEPRPPMAPDEVQKKAQDTHTRDGRPVRGGDGVMAGPADTYLSYKKNWANVSNAPFRMYKRFVHEGGVATPFIAYWPATIKATSATHTVRAPAHLVDLMPTLLDAAGTTYPAEHNGIALKPVEGISLLPLLTDAGTVKRAAPIFFEHEGNRAVRDGRWKLVAAGLKGQWELYDMTVDRGETNDLASSQPDVVKRLSAEWQSWAENGQVLPLGGYKGRRGRDKGH